MRTARRIQKALRDPGYAIARLEAALLARLRLRVPVRVRLRRLPWSLYVDPLDAGISRDLLVTGERETHATAFLDRILRPGQTVVDVGANIGYYAVLEGRRVGPAGRVLAIEPHPRNARILRKNVRALGLQRVVRVEVCAVSDRNGEGLLHEANRSNLHTLERTPAMDRYVIFLGTRPVRTVRLDDLLAELGYDKSRVALIRMDVEGHEVRALEGMRETLEAARDIVLFWEIHPKLIKEARGAASYQAFLTELDRAGFEVLFAAASLSSRDDAPLNASRLSELADLDEAVEVFLGRKAARARLQLPEACP